jgi:hypothetical protein
MLALLAYPAKRARNYINGLIVLNVASHVVAKLKKV